MNEILVFSKDVEPSAPLPIRRSALPAFKTAYPVHRVHAITTRAGIKPAPTFFFGDFPNFLHYAQLLIGTGKQKRR
jgi:hypothetical protein